MPCLGLSLVVALAAQPPAFELRPRDTICIVGNTLAERMQHHGWLETYLQAQPDADDTEQIRNTQESKVNGSFQIMCLFVGNAPADRHSQFV